jgi:DNA-binding response OmpR family regulator
VWGGSEVVGISALKQYIWRLRQKIEEQPKRPCLILTRRGLGYLFKK